MKYRKWDAKTKAKIAMEGGASRAKSRLLNSVIGIKDTRSVLLLAQRIPG